MELWDKDGRLRHKLFDNPSRSELSAALDELCVGVSQGDCDLFFQPGRALGDACPEMTSGCVPYRGIRNGYICSCKFKLGTLSNRADDLFKDCLYVNLEAIFQPMAERNLQDRMPIFVTYYSKDRCISMGYYEAVQKVQNEGRQRNKRWQFKPCHDQGEARTRALQNMAPLTSSVPSSSHSPSDRSRSPHRRVMDVSPTLRSRLPATNTRRTRLIEDFEYDSELERVHHCAMLRMGIEYIPNPETFFLGDETRVEVYDRYTPDASATLRVNIPRIFRNKSLQVLVEIKPTPPTVEERRKLYALAKQLDKKVLCIYGDCKWVLTPNAMLEVIPGYKRPANEPFQAKLYVPAPKKGEDPELFGGLQWRCDERGYYIGVEPSCPNTEEMESIRRVYKKAYDQASKDWAGAPRKTILPAEATPQTMAEAMPEGVPSEVLHFDR
jgi:hypothetical protein